MAPLALSFASVVLSFPCGQCEAAVHPSARCRARGATITDLPAWPSKVEQELVVAEKGSQERGGRREPGRPLTFVYPIPQASSSPSRRHAYTQGTFGCALPCCVSFIGHLTFLCCFG